MNRWWRAINSAVFENGAVTGFLHNAENMSDHVIAARNDAIRERQVDRLSSIAYWQFTPAEGTAMVSTGLNRLFELPETSGVVSAEPYVDRYTPDSRARVLADFEAIAGQAPGTPMVGEYEIEVPRAGRRWIQLSGQLVRENDHDPDIYVGVSMDVTAARGREAKLTATLIERDRFLK